MNEEPLADSAFLVLALLAEREAHGYELQKLAHTRGFRFWTRLTRSSIYNALSALEGGGLVNVRAASGGGPERRVYRITRAGRDRLRRDTLAHLAAPSHPRHELDLGIYALPFVSLEQSREAIESCLDALHARDAFLSERLEWCRARELVLPALAFERPLLALRAEIAWLERVLEDLPALAARESTWAGYEYREPPAPEGEAPVAKRKRGSR
jgi:DNA-binding PadR family transcriptional regulator